MRINRYLAASLLGLLLASLAVVFTGSAASAAPASGTAAAAAPCHYRVVYNNTAVRENPDTNSVIRKYKQSGQGVTGPCRRIRDAESGVWFTAVNCACATDRYNIGWIRTSSLV